MNQLHLTVATVVEHDGLFLMVEEETDDGLRLNQPAGHLEPGESVLEGAIREALEETAYRVRPRAFLGIYRWQHPAKPLTYVRLAIIGDAAGPEPGRPLDRGIVQTLWLPLAEIEARPQRLRSPLVLRCIEDYTAGRRYPLELIRDIGLAS